jgi:hypothetical protein
MVDTWRGLRRCHGGALAGYRADIMRFPDQHFSAIVLCNLAQINLQNYAERMAGTWRTRPATPAVRATAAETKPGEPALSGAASRLTRSTRPGARCDVDRGTKGDACRDRGEGPRGTTQTVSKDSYTADGMEVKFARDAKGKVNALLVTVGRPDRPRLGRRAIERCPSSATSKSRPLRS